MKVSKLTYHQYHALRSLFSLDLELGEIVGVDGLTLTKTTLSFPEESADDVGHRLSDGIWYARAEQDRGTLNALHSVARKLEAIGVEVDR